MKRKNRKTFNSWHDFLRYYFPKQYQTELKASEAATPREQGNILTERLLREIKKL